MTTLLAVIAIVAVCYLASALRCWAEVRRYRMPREVRCYRRLLRGMPAQARFQLQDRLARRAGRLAR